MKLRDALDEMDRINARHPSRRRPTRRLLRDFAMDLALMLALVIALRIVVQGLTWSQAGFGVVGFVLALILTGRVLADR